jgi:hypothetical protein
MGSKTGLGRTELAGMQFISYFDTDKVCGDKDSTDCENYGCIWNPFIDPEEEFDCDCDLDDPA